MNKVLEEIKKIGIVPVVVLDDAKDAEPLAKSIVRGRTSLCRGYIPYRSSRRVDSHHF